MRGDAQLANFYIYNLRSTFVYEIAMRGVALCTISERFRHIGISVTPVYAAVAPAYLTQATDLL